MSDTVQGLRRRRLLPRPRARRRPVPVLRLAARAVPGAARAAPRRLHGHRLRRGVRGLRRRRHVLLVQLGDGAVPRLPRPPRGPRRRQRADRPAPPRAAVQRPDHDDGPARAPRPPAPADAPAHAQAVEGERGVRVAARRPPARRARRPRRVRAHRRLRQPVHAVRHRRPPRRPGGGARGVPPGPGAPAAPPGRRQHDGRDLAQPARRGSTTASAATIEDRRREPRGDVLTAHGDDDLPRRHAPRGDRRRPHRRQPLRRRTGDDGAAARLRAAAHRRGPGSPVSCSGIGATSSGTSWRRRCGSRPR